MSRTDPPGDAPPVDDRLPIGRTILTGLLLRRFGLLPLVALAIAGRGVSPARRRLVLTVAAAVYLGAFAVLLILVVLLVAGFLLVALRAA